MDGDTRWTATHASMQQLSSVIPMMRNTPSCTELMGRKCGPRSPRCASFHTRGRWSTQCPGQQRMVAEVVAAAAAVATSTSD